MLVTFHSDEPGVVGKLGSQLGNDGINITRMQIGTASNGGGEGGEVSAPALGILNLDREPTADQLDAIRQISSITRAALVR